MTILRLRLLSTGEYRIVVHLDPAKLVSDQPDEQYVLRLTWPPKPDGLTHAAYLQQERPAIRDWCATILARLNAAEGAALPGEGDAL